MQKWLLLLLVFITIPSYSKSREVFKIEVGSNYDSYSNKELRRRVWQLERAVEQLQEQVFQLAMDKNGPGYGHTGLWTCHIQSFGTHTATGLTRAGALAEVLKKCGDASNPIHCKENDVKCDNK